MNKQISQLENLSRAEKRALLENFMHEGSSKSQSIHPLSHGQRALWHMQRLMPGSPAYNVSTGWRILSELNIAALQRTFQWLVDRHASLRTTYTIQDQEPVQVVHPYQKVFFRIHEVSDWSDKEFQNEFNDEAYHVFDLEKGPLMRVSLFLRRPGDHILLISCHHIALDLWSLTLLFQDIHLLYPAAVAGKRPPPWPSRNGYIDFVRWQQKMLAGPDGKRLWQYWRKKLDIDFQDLDLPIDFPRPAFQTFEGAMYPFRLGRNLTGKIQNLARSKQTTLHTVLLAGTQTLFYRYSNQSDFLIGSLAVGRSRAEFERTVGFFVNPVMLRADFSNNPTFNAVLDRVQQTVTEAIEHQDFPFSLLIEKLGPGREMNRNPLSDVLFILQTPHRFIAERKGQNSVPHFGIFAPGKAGTRVDLGGLLLEPYNPEQKVTQNDLAIEMVEAGGDLSGAIHYRTNLFRLETIERLANHYRQLLAGAVEEPQQLVSRLNFLSESERRHILYEWNDTQVQYAEIESVHQLFERQVEKTPDNTALLYRDKCLTYRQLNNRANRMARFLRRSGIGPETLVCISMERSPDLIVAMLGVLKASGAFMPIEASSPPERLNYILKDADPKVILTENHLKSAFGNAECPVVCLDSNGETISGFEKTCPDYPVCGSNLAYLIYTSGSTGRPKGVMVEHRSVVNMIHSFNQSYKTGAGDRVMQQTSISFDVAIGEIFPVLSSGGTLCLPTCEELEDLEKRLHYVNKYQITILGAAPSLLAQINQRAHQLSSVRLILSGGEALSISDIDKLLQVTKVTNGYGPTETTVCSTFHIIENPLESKNSIADEKVSGGHNSGLNKIPIGKPIANTRIYILDARMHPVPVGIPGEIYIGGAGLSRGYLHSPELTAEKFIPNPFATHPNERLYKTGDLACYLPDGEIVFLGRVDSQVKVRGFRVEIEEIEITLCLHPLVEKACVIPLTRGAHTDRLIAYVVPHNEPFEVDSLRTFLKERLPHYMIPSFFMFKDRLPLTASGKVDRSELAEKTEYRLFSNTEYVAPRNDAEEMVAGIWAEVLGLEQVGVHDDFFELGGHSLLATQVISRLRNTFQLELPLRALFEAPTVADLAARITIVLQTERKLQAPPIHPVSRKGNLPLSFAQQRLWFLDQLMPGSPAYNMPSAVRVRGKLNLAALEQSLNEVVNRHESLRTTFPVVAGQPVQKISSKQKLALPVLDLMGLPEFEREPAARGLATDEVKRPFDLAQGPLIRTSLLRLGEEDYIVLLTIHHIISDGWSAMVFVQEMVALYHAFSSGQTLQLPELPIQYADFAVWQRQWLQGEVLETQLAYWKKQLGKQLPMLDLPTDRPRSISQSINGAVHSFVLPKILSEKLKVLSRQKGVTLFMILLTAYKTLLFRYTGQEDVTVGSPIANRNRAEVEGLIGFFVNTLVLRTDLSGNPTFLELLGRVREVCLGAYAHQDLPFEKLVEVLQPKRDMNYTPLVQVAFAFQNLPLPELKLSGLTFTPMQVDHVTAQLDLTLLMVEGSDGLIGFLEYKKELFEESTIKRIAKHFQVMLEAITANPDQQISRLPLLTEEERFQLLVEWNDTRKEYPRGECIHQLFEDQAAQTPNAVAVISFLGKTGHNVCKQTTYGELNQRANQLASYLQKLGVGPEVPVGICMERSLEMVVGLLGILKAGGAYLPLDQDYPKERLAFMLQEAQAPVLITQERLVAGLPGKELQIVCLDSYWKIISQESDKNQDSRTVPQNLAYLIYTSGSTGQPKGVLIENRSVVNIITSFNREYNLGADDRIIQQASISFDVSVNEIFPILCAGGALVLPNKEEILDFERLTRLITRHNVTIMGATPSVLSRLNKIKCGLPKVRLILSGGEALSLSDVDNLLASATVTNGYGPTETTVCASCYELSGQNPHSGTTIPIGKPLMNYQLYILDKDLDCMPVGCPGELYIGGEGLARGYLNDPELTSEKFVPNPFVSGERLFRTGDLARWLPSGNIEFLGRIDRQVKIRGLRIEPGEIETVLNQHPAIRETTILDWEYSQGDKRLVAYLVSSDGSLPDISELRCFLREKLPEYMLPAAFVTLDTIPRMPNGKVDRHALPGPDQAQTELEKSYVAPSTAVEKMVAEIWADVIGLEMVGIYDNFFEIGGHSLLAAQLISRVRDSFQVELSLHRLFEMPNVAGMAKSIEQLRRREKGPQGISQTESPLIAIQPNGFRCPLFCVHPATGTILSYANFVRYLGLDQPLYGLQSIGLDGQQIPHTKVESMATHYIEAIFSSQPVGPYLLGGWSLGGLIAFEMAQQLRGQGHEVALLVLFDVPSLADNGEFSEGDSSAIIDSFAKEFGLSLDSQNFSLNHFFELEAEEQLTYLTSRMNISSILNQSTVADLLPYGENSPQFKNYLRVFTTNISAGRNYKPQIYPGWITLFKAAGNSTTDISEENLGWGKLAGEGLDVYLTPGNHATMMQEPHVRVLAERLNVCLKKAQEGR
jgi:amino acid adenylation domain-containing protein